MFRQHTSLVRRGTEFDSRADLRGIVGAIGVRFPNRFILSNSNGLLVQRDDTGIARRSDPRGVPPGFDSPAVHSAESVIEGPMVQGDDVALAWRRSGFDSRWVHSNGGSSDTVCRAVLLRRFPRRG